MVIKTERLIIYPASNEEIEKLISSQTVPELKEAYTEMRNGCLSHPRMREWYAPWMIELKDGTHVGELCFKGIDEYGSTETGYGIADNYRGCGYATEAVTAVVNWALEQKSVNRVIAEIDGNNNASRRVLEKSGFELTDKVGEEGPIYSKEK